MKAVKLPVRTQNRVFLLLIGKNENIFLQKRKSRIYKNNYSNFTVKNVLTMGESTSTVKYFVNTSLRMLQ